MLLNRITLALTLGLMTQNLMAADVVKNDKESDIEVMRIYGTAKPTNSATKLSLSIAQTPQSVIVISRAQIEDFSLNSINELLSFTPGVTVENVETDRTYYTARGFDIVNFQYDSVGVPFPSGIANGHQDSALFEQVEIVKGAAGLVTGLANPSATINYIRKRPTEDMRANVTLSLGENNQRRLEGDVSGSLSENVRGRVVAVKEKGDSYLDRYSDNNSVFYGVIEADLTDKTLLTLGASVTDNNVDGSLSGALPLTYTDGSLTNYDSSTSTATDWAFRNTKRTSYFVHIKQALAQNWDLNIQLSRNEIDMKSDLFYTYGTPDKATEVGLIGYANRYNLDEKHNIADVFVSGQFELFSRQHEVVIGYNHSKIELFGLSSYNYADGFPALTSQWAQGSTPSMTFPDTDNFTTGHKDDQTHKAFYIANRLNVSDDLSLIVGLRHMKVERVGYSYGVDNNNSSKETVPYIGALYSVTKDAAVYGSYSEVFTPQNFVGRDKRAVGVAKGNNKEVGVKYTFNDQTATASLALFKSELDNLAEFGENIDGVNIYDAVTYDSEGLELEVVGALNDNINLSAGFTRLFHIEDATGSKIRTYVPRQTLKVAGSYYFDSIPELSLGASLQWQSEIYRMVGAVKVVQKSYAVIDAFVRYELNDNLSLSVNVSNLTDDKHFNSLSWDQAYYAAPREVQASVSWNY